MKVNIGKYISWIGPYQIAEKILFWKDSNSDVVYTLGEFLAHGFHKQPEEDKRRFSSTNDRPKTWIYKLCEYIHSKKKRKVKIKIDPWDVWSTDATISLLVLPLLIELKKQKHGSGNIDLCDVPEHLQFTSHEEYDRQETFEFYHADTPSDAIDVHTRYEWFLDELIWTFTQLQPDYDWKDQYQSGNIDFVSVPVENKENTLYKLEHGPDYTFVEDKEAIEKHQKRIDNGLRLFSKYYHTLWD
jgi:hypothetical protein